MTELRHLLAALFNLLAKHATIFTTQHARNVRHMLRHEGGL